MKTSSLTRALALGSAALVLAACSSSGSSGSESSAPSGPITADFAREELVKAKLARACAQEEYVKCSTIDGNGGFAVMVMSKDEIDATFTRLCESLAAPSSDPDPETLAAMKMVTDRNSFLVVGEIGLQFPASLDPAAVQKVLGGEIVSMQDQCG